MMDSGSIDMMGANGDSAISMMVRDFTRRAGMDDCLAEICGKVMEEERNGGVCISLDGLSEEQKDSLMASPLVCVTSESNPSSGADEEGRLFVMAHDRFYTRRNWRYEQMVRKRIEDMAKEAPSFDVAIEIPSDGVFKYLNERQREAIQRMASHQFTIMTGGPGTGKTYTIARAVKLIQEQRRDIRLGFAAPTGKAAARVKEAMLKEAEALGFETVPETTTLHSLLGPNYDFVTFKSNRTNPLELDWLIVDEASMVSLSMMAKLLDALPKECRLTLVGDAFQLSSVEPGRVFGDLCRMRLINDNGCKCELTESRRFESGGEIDTLACLIKQGDSKKVLESLIKDGRRMVHYHCIDAKDNKAQNSRENDHSQYHFDKLIETLFADFCRQDTPEGALKALNNCRILCAVHKGLYGYERMNDRVQRILHKIKQNCPIPWMITRNDSALGVNNGDVGVVMPAYDNGAALFLPDGKGMRSVPLALLPEREKAFASTIHKAQGSEYENVIIVLPPVGEKKTDENRAQTRELLYTALTRVKPVEDAKSKEIKGGVYLFANDKSIEECCKNETKRNTGLID